MKKTEKKTESVPFSPALKAIVALHIDTANQRVNAAVNAEAAHLGYPAGTTFDAIAGVWKLPA